MDESVRTFQLSVENIQDERKFHKHIVREINPTRSKRGISNFTLAVSWVPWSGFQEGRKLHIMLLITSLENIRDYEFCLWLCKARKISIVILAKTEHFFSLIINFYSLIYNFTWNRSLNAQQVCNCK